MKGMYSLILADEVVNAVDRLAYTYGTSRSNLINRILAEHLSLMTPERRIGDIFENVVKVAQSRERLQIQYLPSGTMLEVKSAVNYKYNPTIRYSVEIVVTEEGYLGEFRVTSRTQSKSLQNALTLFFQTWDNVERYCLSVLVGEEALPQSESEPGRYRRSLALEQAGEIQDSQQLGEAIGRFIRIFDQSIDLFFEAGARTDGGIINTIAGDYQKYLQNSEIII